MTAALIVDCLIVGVVCLGLVSGYRYGAISSFLSFVGVVAGLIIGLAAAPALLELTDNIGLRFLIAIAVLVLLVGFGQVLGSTLGARLRDGMRQRASQRIDSILGAFFQAIAALLIVWLVSIPMAAGLTGPVGNGLRGSKILGEINKLAPNALLELPRGIGSMLNESGLPPLVAPAPGQEGGPQVEAPSVEVQNPEMVDTVRPSVIHVLGDASECRRRLMGSGFVTAEDYVITNAHVVAGTETVSLDTVVGMKNADVVYYNPEVDLAVLHSPGLGLKPLEWAPQPAQRGDDAVVMGFPQSGPFNANPARVRSRITIAGPDIYSTGRIEREAYTLRGHIQQGNSGGPLLDAEGSVLGVVFGAAVDDVDTGYALTGDEVRSHIGDISDLTEPADTGACVAR